MLANQRKKLRDICTKAEYWTEDNNKRLHLLEQVERICLKADFEQISALCESLTNITIYENAINQLKNCVCFFFFYSQILFIFL